MRTSALASKNDCVVRRHGASVVVASLFAVAVAKPVLAAEHDSWTSYMKKNRYECPGPFDTLKKPRTLTLAGKKYIHNGYQLRVENPDADHRVIIGVVSALKDISEGTRHNVERAFAWFEKEGVEWVVANGDLALEELDLEDVVDLLGHSGLPTLVILGNSESRGSWARVFKDRSERFPNLVNGNWVRQVIADDVEFWTVPGYHDRRFVHQGAGRLYKQEDIDVMREQLKPAGVGPVVLVAHGPPRGKGKHAIDRMFEGKNVGDPMLTELISKMKIPFGLFGHILEAGGTAVGHDLRTPVRPKKMVRALYLNAGSLSGDPWGMNDGSASTGMATIVKISGSKASFQVRRFKP